MTDRYADLRTALNLDLPPCPGMPPGLAELHDADNVCVACFSDCDPVEQERRPVPTIEAGDRFAQYVAAADKETVRALLADFDEASARAFYETSVAQAAIEQVKKLEAERNKLRDALEAIGTYPLARGQEMSAESMREIARAALAQEQGESE